MPRRMAQYFATFVAVGFFACIFYFAHLARISPMHPDPVTGQVVQMNNHGSYFYVYPWQGWVLQAGPFACVGVLLAIAFMGQRLNLKLAADPGPPWLFWVFFAAVVAIYAFFGFP